MLASLDAKQARVSRAHAYLASQREAAYAGRCEKIQMQTY